MSKIISFPNSVALDSRFCVVGWNSEQNDLHEHKVSELREYAARASASGLTSDEIIVDILDASGGLFDSVEISYVRRSNGKSVVSVVAIASGYTGSSSKSSGLEAFSRLLA